MLREHPWNFAKARQILAQLSTAPAFKWEYAYAMPTDCLKLRKVVGSDGVTEVDWEIVGNELHTNSAYAYAEYTTFIDDAGLVDSLFAEAMSARLAIEVGQKLAPDPNLLGQIQKVAMTRMERAMWANQTERNQTPDTSDSWLDAR
jgi:hypothetical protein